MQRARIFLIARGDAGRNGLLLSCNDSAVPVTVMLPAEEPPLEGALRVLLGLPHETLAGTNLLNPLGLSRLRVESTRVEDGRAEIRLSGALRLTSWPCNSEWIRAQLEQTALQFQDIREVEFRIDDRPLSEWLERRVRSSPPGGTASLSDPLPPRAGPGEPAKGTEDPLGQR